VGLILRVVRTISTACQVFIFNYFLNFFNKFFLKIFISFIFISFYILTYKIIKSQVLAVINFVPNYLTPPAGLLLTTASQPSFRRIQNFPTSDSFIFSSNSLKFII